MAAMLGERAIDGVREHYTVGGSADKLMEIFDRINSTPNRVPETCLRFQELPRTIRRPAGRCGCCRK